MALTLKNAASKLGLSIKMLKERLVQAKITTRDQLRDPGFRLQAEEFERLRLALTHADEAANSASKSNSLTAQVESMVERFSEQKVPFVAEVTGVRTFAPATHRIFVNPDIFQEVKGIPSLQKRLNLVLQQLTVDGRTSIVKSCSDTENKGWRRSPLGGNNGMHYYAWWAPGQTSQVQHLPLLGDDILVAAVRHHDDHWPLKVVSLDGFEQRKQASLLNSDEVPWTSSQRQFVESKAPLRLLMGCPGSGKTTALWLAVERLSSGRALYVTWSKPLVEQAKSHFQVFASQALDVVALDAHTAIAQIAGLEVERLNSLQAYERFLELLRDVPQKALASWQGREHLLFKELRATFCGASIPGTAGDNPQMRATQPAFYLKPLEHVADRATFESERASRMALIAIFEQIHDRLYRDCFPEIAAARVAIEKLQKGELPLWFADFDRIAVDEVQDLTTVESAVFIELAAAIQKHRGTAPSVLVAGDAAQTVRPTGFNWASLKVAISYRLGRPEEFRLAENMRSSAKLAELVQSVGDAYRDLPKAFRPEAQSRSESATQLPSRCLKIEATPEDAARLCERLRNDSSVGLLLPREVRAPWLTDLPAEVQDQILTPAQAKGLSFQTVLLFDLDPACQAIVSLIQSEHERSFAHDVARASLDQMRVALSRAVETLCVVEVAEKIQFSTEEPLILGCPAVPYSADEFLAEFENDFEPEICVNLSLNNAQQLQKLEPIQIWRALLQAVAWLPEINDPKHEKTSKLLEIISLLLIEKSADAISKPLCDLGESLAQQLGHSALFSALKSCSESSRVDLLLAFAEAHSPAWALPALCKLDLIDSLAECANSADFAHILAQRSLDEAVKTLAPNVSLQALRVQAFDVLIQAGKIHEADAVYSAFSVRDLKRELDLREAVGAYASAAMLSLAMADKPRAVENLRRAGMWQRALEKALEGNPRLRDLEWLASFEKLLESAPAGLWKRLDPAEAQRLWGELEKLKEK